VTGKRPQDQDTRQRLLEVATRQFAEHGYKHVTIRAISEEARANVAAVNYHFRDKMGLYREVLEAAFELLHETTGLAVRAGEGKPAEEQLRAYIRVHAERILAARGPSAIQQLIQRETTEPSQELGPLVEKVLKPRFEYLYGIIGKLLGLPAGDERVRLCALSIHGLILMFRPTPMAEKFGAVLKMHFSPERVTAHLIDFSMAGIEAYRERPPKPRARSRRTVRR
jgi:AcrR family transcriptional regulator